MKIKMIGFSFFLLFLTHTGFCQSKSISIVTDQAYWYPFTFVQKGQPKGIHIDVVQKALTNLNYSVNFYPKPWKRCLQDAKAGKYDAIVSASYKPERAQYLFYPEDASSAKKSAWRITQVAYVVITNASSPYLFNGDVTSLPSPVRTPLGYSISDDLKSAGVNVLEAPDIIDCINQLVKSGRGSFITPPQNAVIWQADNRFKGRLKIHEMPIKSKSYYMGFAVKNQKLNQTEISAIWDEIAKVREDQVFMTRLFNEYKGQK